MDTDVFKRYYEGDCEYNGVRRRAALVFLTAASENGYIKYTVGVSFFPHEDEEDFAVSYDAVSEKIVYSGKGRRSKKRESGLIEKLEAEADGCACDLGGTIFWDKPFGEPRFG